MCPQARPVVGAALARPWIGKLVKARAPDFEMEMGSAGVAGAGGFGDLLTTPHLIPGTHAQRALFEMIVARRKNARNIRVTNDDHVASGKAPEAASTTRATIGAKGRADRVPYLCARCEVRWSLAVGFIGVRALIVFAVERKQDHTIGRRTDRGARDHRLGADADVRSFVPWIARLAAIMCLSVFVRIRIADAKARLIRNTVDGPRQPNLVRRAAGSPLRRLNRGLHGPPCRMRRRFGWARLSYRRCRLGE